MALDKKDLSLIQRLVRDHVGRIPPRPLKAMGIGRITGSPEADTPPASDSSDRIATTSFVQKVVATLSPVLSVFGRTGNVTAQTGDYTAAQVTNAADLSASANQTFTGNVVAASFITEVAGSNNSYRNYLLPGDAQPAVAMLGNGTLKYGGGGSSTADVQIGRLTAGRMQIEAIGGLATGLTIGDGTHVGRVDDAGGGILITNSTGNKVGFYGITPVVQPSAVGAATGYSAGTTTATFHEDDKYTGNVGTTAYTINGIVAALKNLGLIKS